MFIKYLFNQQIAPFFFLKQYGSELAPVLVIGKEPSPRVVE